MNNPNAIDNLKPFKKGDPRINRKGRPKSFDALRKLAVNIAGENAPASDITRIEKMLRDMSSSKIPADKALFLAYAYGKPPDKLEQTGEVKVVIEYADSNPTKTT